MSSIIRRRNGVIAISLRSKIGWAPPAQPGEEILSTVPISDAALPLGEAVQSNAGNFIDSGLGRASTVEKTSIISILYGPIPYASEQGIFYGLAGNLNRRSGKFPP
jgi:hypothetical protein